LRIKVSAMHVHYHNSNKFGTNDVGHEDTSEEQLIRHRLN
jgi:hypothetical protein